jgi:flagellar protein FlaG
MTSHVPPLPPHSGLGPWRPAAGHTPPPGAPAVPAARPVDRVELHGDATIPDAPPAEVLAELHVAGRVVAELHARGRELRFASDPDSGRIVVEVRDLDGNVLRRIPPSDALRVASGDLEI